MERKGDGRIREERNAQERGMRGEVEREEGRGEVKEEKINGCKRGGGAWG